MTRRRRRGLSPPLLCPYCGERLDIYVDPGGGPAQDYVEDCSVCCRPIRFRATWNTESEEFEISAVADR